MEKVVKYVGGALLFLVVGYFLDEWRQQRRLNALSPGRAPTPSLAGFLGLGMVYGLIKSSIESKDSEFMLRLFKGPNVNTIGAKVIAFRVVFTIDPENIKAMLATQFKDFGKGKAFHDQFEPLLGDSIFSTDGQTWSESRQLIRPQFVKARVSDLDIFERHSKQLIHVIESAKGAPVAIDDLFFAYTLDAATEFLLGTSVNALENPDDKFAVAFAEVQRVQSIIIRAGPFEKCVPRKSYLAGCAVIDEFVEPFIEQSLRLNSEKSEKSESEGTYTFLHALAAYTRDKKVLRDQLVAVLLAGRDTTAGTLSWTFHELSQHPEVLAKLRQEILAAVGPERAPSYDDLKNMKYLQHCMNETLRMYPSVPFNVRFALQDTTLPRGGGPDGMAPIAVLKGCPIGYSTLVMQRRPDLYPTQGSDGQPLPGPDVYYPDRFNTWQPKLWQYIPFNGGPRLCVGQQYALTEMGYTLVRLLQRFSIIEKRWEDSKQFLRSDLVLRPGSPVLVSVR